MTSTKSPIRRASHLLQDAFHYAWGVFSTESCLPVENRDTPKPTVAQRREQLDLAALRASEAFGILGETDAAALAKPSRAPRTHAALDLAAERLMQLVGQVGHAHGVNAMCGVAEGVEETAVLPPYYRVVGYDLAAEQAETARKRDEAARELADHDGALRETRHATASKTLTPDEWDAVVKIAGDIARSLDGNFESDEAIEELLDAAFEGTGHAAKVVTNMKISLKMYCDTRGYFRAAAQLDAEDAAAESKRAAYVARATEVAAKITAEMNAPGAPWRAVAAQLVGEPVDAQAQALAAEARINRASWAMHVAAEGAAELDAEDAAHVKAHGVPPAVATLRGALDAAALRSDLLGRRLDRAASLATLDDLREEANAALASARELVEALGNALDETLGAALDAADETETERRTRVAAEANTCIVKRGVAPLTVTSTRKHLCRALQTIDPNGCHIDENAVADGCEPHTLDSAWDALAEMVS